MKVKEKYQSVDDRLADMFKAPLIDKLLTDPKAID